MDRAPFDLVVRNTSEVLTLQGAFESGAEAALAAIPRGALGIVAGKVDYVGPEALLPSSRISPQTQTVDAGGGFVGPGFVDCHTHVVFAGERAHEFELRNQGKSYLEIGQAGGGIMSTVRATRTASAEELAALALPRLTRLLEHGITTAEVKSGYGLNVDDELKMLEVIRTLSGQQPVELLATLLCAHALPPEYKDDRPGYLRLCTEQLIPRVAQGKLACFCDAFVEQGAFDIAETEALMTTAMSAGLIPRLHVDQLSSLGGAQLAAKLKAASADHLEQISDEGIRALAQSNTVAVVMPLTTSYLHVKPFAPGRKLWDAGVRVALATNLNPGSSMSENLALTLGLACLHNGLTAAEAYWAATRGGALALRLEKHGQLTHGGPADFVVFSCDSYRHLPYHLGINHVRTVVKAGRPVAQAPGSTPCSS